MTVRPKSRRSAYRTPFAARRAVPAFATLTDELPSTTTGPGAYGNVAGNVVVDDGATDGTAACDVCGHDLAVHDHIADRFCRATFQNALSRGCICASP